MLSRNEWDPLKRIIVGTASGAQIPPLTADLRAINYAHVADESTILSGLYPAQVIEQANEDLAVLCDFLRSEGVDVVQIAHNRPNYYNYCPRDSVLVYDDLILACPQPLQARANEYMAMDAVFTQYAARYIAETPARLPNLYDLACLGDKNKLALTEAEPAFDAANILRANDDLYYLVSNSGNQLGAQRLQELVPNKRVWPIQGVYSFMHIDSTITLLREGLMLLNPSRIKSVAQLPAPLQSWDVIWCPEPVDIGHYPGYCGSSPWLNMNLLSVNPDLVIIEQHQHNLRTVLEAHGIECAMLPGRHQITLGGGFHCVTLDLERQHAA